MVTATTKTVFDSTDKASDWRKQLAIKPGSDLTGGNSLHTNVIFFQAGIILKAGRRALIAGGRGEST